MIAEPPTERAVTPSRHTAIGVRLLRRDLSPVVPSHDFGERSPSRCRTSEAQSPAPR